MTNQNLWERMTREYVIITDLQRNILETGENVRRLFQGAAYPETCMEYFAKASHNEILGYNKKKYRVEVNRTEENYVIIFRDCTREKELEKQVENLDTLAQNYEMLFNNFGDSSMYVTDGKGITTWVGKQVALTCGVAPEFLIGKSVYDLEAEGIFYPSITVKVLESLSYETLVQHTAKGQQAIAMGFPLFDKNNHLVKVISFSKPMREKELADSEFVTDYEPDIFYPEIISASPVMAEVKNMVEACSKVDTPVMIYGETGIRKKEIAKCIHKISKRCNNDFCIMKVEDVPKNEMMEVLFGKESIRDGLVYRADGGTLYITNLYALPFEVQKRLFRVVKGEGLMDENGMVIHPDVRYIAGSVKRLTDEEIAKQHCQFLHYRFQAMEIEVPPLRERRDDILLLIRYYQHIYKERYGVECAFTSEAMQLLYAYDWTGNIQELEKFVQSKVLSETHTLIDVEELPEYIIHNEESRKADNMVSIKQVIPLNDAVSRMECALIKMALAQCKNAKEAAQLLEINQSTLSRKIQKYGIKINE